MRGFADLPGQIEALTRAHERVAVVLLDAFGLEFVERHADHPLLRRLDIEPLATQFPSTTTAHLTTLYSGLPVEEHGLYEWRVYEPRAGEVITPLRAQDLNGIVPRPSFFERLDVPSLVLQPAHIGVSPYSSVAFAGATIELFETLEEGVRRLGAPGLSHLYWDAIDSTGHDHGPSSEAFDAVSRAALDALEAALPRDTVLVVTADHGQIDVSPERLDLLDELWPDLAGHLTQAPAGSSRDCFLHVDEPGLVIEELASRLGDRAQVVRADTLFTNPGPRLRERLADVCVLPAPGRVAWLASHPSRQLGFLGHHGGRTEAESQTWVGIAST